MNKRNNDAKVVLKVFKRILIENYDIQQSFLQKSDCLNS